MKLWLTELKAEMSKATVQNFTGNPWQKDEVENQHGNEEAEMLDHIQMKCFVY